MTIQKLCILVFISFLMSFGSHLYAQPKWQVSYGGTSEWTPQAVGSSWNLQSRHYADFDGDGKDDIFIYKNGQFIYSSGANQSWTSLNGKYNQLTFEDLRFGDFNGDGKTDVFFEWNGKYGYTSGGKGEFIPLLKADIPLDRLGIGDFNGDGLTDIIWQPIK